MGPETDREIQTRAAGIPQHHVGGCGVLPPGGKFKHASVTILFSVSSFVPGREEHTQGQDTAPRVSCTQAWLEEDEEPLPNQDIFVSKKKEVSTTNAVKKSNFFFFF